MAQPQNNYNDWTDRQNAVLERIGALEVENRMLKEEIALFKSAKFHHYLLIGLLFYMLVLVPIFSGAMHLCWVTIDNLWFLAFSIVFYLLLLYFVFDFFVMVWVETASQKMCEPLRELLEKDKTQKADLRELRQEEEAIRRAQERLRRQEQIRQKLRMAGCGLYTEDILRVLETFYSDEDDDNDMNQCTICLEQFNLYGDVAILSCQHIFHQACIQPWLQRNNTCPVCRAFVEWRCELDMGYRDFSSSSSTSYSSSSSSSASSLSSSTTENVNAASRGSAGIFTGGWF